MSKSYRVEDDGIFKNLFENPPDMEGVTIHGGFGEKVNAGNQYDIKHIGSDGGGGDSSGGATDVDDRGGSGSFYGDSGGGESDGGDSGGGGGFDGDNSGVVRGSDVGDNVSSRSYYDDDSYWS